MKWKQLWGLECCVGGCKQCALTQRDINKLHKHCNGLLFGLSLLCFKYIHNFGPNHAILFYVSISISLSHTHTRALDSGLAMWPNLISVIGNVCYLYKERE